MSEDAPDLSLSKYRLGARLGAGGMGEVYLAHDVTLNRDVAIKFIAPDRLGDRGARKRLLREAQAAAALDHPSICAVHEVSVDDPSGRAFIVMQYVEGETLAERLTRGPLDVREALDLTAHVADALAERTPAQRHPPRPEAAEHHHHPVAASEDPRLRHSRGSRSPGPRRTSGRRRQG